MKVEKINENKIRITLSIDELKQRNITLRDIEKDSIKAKKLFLELIEESNLESTFIFEHAQLFVEASTDNSDFFTVTITKIDDFPDLAKYNLIDQNLENNSDKKPSISSDFNLYNIFSFNSINTIIDMCDVLNKNKYFLGKSSLMKYEDKYFLIFSKYSVKNPKFLATYSVLNEFSSEMYENNIYEISIREKSKLIIKDKALQTLKNI